jgi:hypothetical protein
MQYRGGRFGKIKSLLVTLEIDLDAENGLPRITSI